MSKPIRVGIIGLSAKGGWASVSHLPYLQKSAKYLITAICNSSPESSRAAIEKYGLPADTKAYGSPQDLASDPNVDLVLSSVNVADHYDTILPAVKAGKDVYCEWPLGKNLAEAEELNRIAKENGCRTIVGLQGTQSPYVAKIREIIAAGKIGRVLSTTFVGCSTHAGPQEREAVEYLFKADVGGNPLTIFFGHSFQTVSSVLGELASFSSLVDIRVPTVELTDLPSNDPARRVVRTIKRETHDQVLLQGRFEEDGVLLAYHLHVGKAIAPGEGLRWRILGDHGEIAIAASGTNLHGANTHGSFKVYDNRTDEVVDVTPLADEWDALPPPAQNTARVYEAFADGKTDGFPDWDLAVRRHKLIDEIYQREKDGKQDQKAVYTE
ncbi:hypothetical protein BX600DRAFT_444842 [Xylariales sp. PMI_506]|nr:hypothetical protein BX600DRAFT_444842 [Xylariales sp. PMI_506]